jgi:hypothetical protein
MAQFFWKGFAPVANPLLTAFPGQPGNPVGFAATPGVVPQVFKAFNGQTWPGAYPGSLTAWPGGTGSQNVSDGTFATSGAGTPSNPWVYAFYIFDALTAGTAISAANTIFVGCCFQSNQTGNVNVETETGVNNALFIYCTIQPRNALLSSPPCTGFGIWPAAPAFQQIGGGAAGPFLIPAAVDYQFGINYRAGTGTIQADHCDIFGFTNAITFQVISAVQNVTDCWIHDCADGSGGAHLDGPGYLQGSTGPSNILVQHCTIAMSGNTNCIALQGATTNWNNIVVNNNYLSGNENTIFMCNSAGTNLSFTNNILGTELPYVNVAVYGGGTPPNTIFAVNNTNNNLWRGNKIKVAAGTTNLVGATPTYTSANDGQFIWPDNTLNTTDWM